MRPERPEPISHNVETSLDIEARGWLRVFEGNLESGLDLYQAGD